ncbi:cyclic pyranopterin monophosphate synthase MoaC [Maricaulis maris]|jgi:cyclic pyranopterin phosphate synthase|uniref:Cyclic pyranopterin monophosphate synthase n=1 Tax=Maricaulis maris (strain MCS10) TaxID=394221 RepID=Q0AL42_MARMM|nr:cyclic pyranopterin monophosphate synthase MoaC [Maricaulis maris]ABI67001.1 GTP cyclohydrolase subunit MoaC [Maricaulis maris MCS10]
MTDRLTHQDEVGRVRMVAVGDKAASQRRAIAGARLSMTQTAFEAVRNGQGPKGNALYAAELAGIMAAKRTSDLIPLCHPLPLTSVKVSIEATDSDRAFEIRAEVTCDGKTGVEMEALTAASVAALTLYDMAKALDKSMVIDAVRLLEKQGGKSGDYHREEPSE